MIPRSFTVLLATSLAINAAAGAEITSNGRGGGDWSDPATWLGKKVPGPEDDAVIQKGDTVHFDRDDDGKITCRKLFIDPRGVFRMKNGMGKVTCCLAGPLETRGLIQLDGTKSAADFLELRFVATEQPQRLINLRSGGALIARGGDCKPEDRRNVAIRSPKVGTQKDELEAWIKATESGAAIDLHRADLVNVVLQVSELDNTGSRTNERLNVVENRFTGRGRIAFSKCDTPVIRKNSFECEQSKGMGVRAIHFFDCSLGEVRDNTIRGFGYAFAANNSSDCTVAGNTVENCRVGLHFHVGRNHSAYRNTFRDCECALDISHIRMMTAADDRIEGAKRAVQVADCTAQIASLEVTKLAKDGMAIYCHDPLRPSQLLLINAGIRPEQVQLDRVPQVPPKAPLMVAMNYLVVAVKDAPPNAAVEVRTVNPMPPLAPGAADLNVRNSPALLTKGWTPVPRPAGAPQARLPLLVKSWVMDQAGKIVPAPEYEVRILEVEGDKLLKSVRVRPQADWYRGPGLDRKPTLEVSLK